MENRYFKYKSTWVLYALGVGWFLFQWSDLVASMGSGTAWLVASALGGGLAPVVAVWAGVRWIIFKRDAPSSLLVGFLIALAILMLGMSVTGVAVRAILLP